MWEALVLMATLLCVCVCVEGGSVEGCSQGTKGRGQTLLSLADESHLLGL